jgi:chorismate synthase
MVAAIDAAAAAGDTLGGVVEVVARGVVLGLGSHVSWDRRLDGRLAQAVMSIPAVKGVEIGLGFEGAQRPGSEAHDEEGGMTTGEPLIIRAAMKPLSTLRRPLQTINLDTGNSEQAQSERSDVTAVPAMGVVAEAMTAVVLAGALVEKLGGDSLAEMREHFQGQLERLAQRGPAPPASGE